MNTILHMSGRRPGFGLTFAVVVAGVLGFAVSGCDPILSRDSMANAQTYSLCQPMDKAPVWKRITSSGVALSVVARIRKPQDDTPLSAVQVSTKRGRFRLASLHQLEKLVVITDPENALVFVRLRTSPALTDCWADATIHEIVSLDYARTSEYSRTNWGVAHYNPGETWQIEPGEYGILATAAYRAGGFDPVIVRRTKAGYIVIRWVRIFDKRGIRCEKWQESVTESGTYHCDVLRSEAPPTLPGNSWYAGMEGRA